MPYKDLEHEIKDKIYPHLADVTTRMFFLKWIRRVESDAYKRGVNDSIICVMRGGIIPMMIEELRKLRDESSDV